jgi:hypothetical protein
MQVSRSGNGLEGSHPLRIGLHASPAHISPDNKLDRAPPIMRTPANAVAVLTAGSRVSLNCIRLRAEAMARCDAICTRKLRKPVAFKESIELTKNV